MEQNADTPAANSFFAPLGQPLFHFDGFRLIQVNSPASDITRGDIAQEKC